MTDTKPAAKPKRRVRSPHPGVVLIPPDLASRHDYWRARIDDPDTGRLERVKLDPVLSTERARRDWAIRKSRELARRRMDLEAGAPRFTATPVAEAVERYFTAHPHLSPASVEGYRRAASRFVTWAKRVNVVTCDELTRARLMTYREKAISEPKRRVAKGGRRGARHAAAERRSPESINGELRKVRTILGYLRKLDLLPKLSTDDLRDGLQRIRAPVERIDYLRPGEITDLLDAAQKHDEAVFVETRAEHAGQGERGSTRRYEPIRPFVLFVLLTGMRFREALYVEWSDVDLTAKDHDGRPVGEIYVAGARTKTKRGRTVGLEVSPLLRAMLTTMADEAADSDAKRVFTISEHLVEAAARRLKNDFGAPARFTWQLLRRTCGTYLTNAPGIFGAASAYRSAKQLGHSVTVAERHYVGLVRGIPHEARTLEAAMGIAGLPLR